MNTERDKYLTEAMGECWHEMYHYVDYSECKKCGMTDEQIAMYPDNNFSTWECFGKLWNWAQKQGWWYRKFADGWDASGGISAIRTDLVHPDRFADAIYAYLKEVGCE